MRRCLFDSFECGFFSVRACARGLDLSANFIGRCSQIRVFTELYLLLVVSFVSFWNTNKQRIVRETET